MTTRATALTVILEGDPREDDIEDLITAIRRLRGVADVLIIEQTAHTEIAKQKARIEIAQRVYTALKDILL